MDGNRFDDLARTFSQRRSRRQLLKALTGTLAGLAVGLTGRGTRSPFAGGDAAAQPACTLTCPANITVSNDPNQCGAGVTYPAPTATGTCGTITCSPASGSFFPVGTTPVTCTSTAGPTCSFTVTVNDTQAPTITCPSDFTVPSDVGQCGAAVDFPITASDNCPGVTFVCNHPPGSTFDVGTTPVTCTATDGASNSSSCSFALTVLDAEIPHITCPPDLTVGNDPGLCSAVVDYTPPGASDNCPGVTFACDPPPGSTFDVGDTTVLCEATDASALTEACEFTITVNDTENPLMTCPPDTTVDAAPGEDSAIVDYPDPDGSDNCPGASLVCYSPASFLVGTTPVTCTTTDTSGNTVDCAFTVTVNAVAAPTATAPATAPPEANPTATTTSGVTTLPSTGAAPTDSPNGIARWGPLAAVGGAAAYVAARFRKAARADESTSDEGK
jgi:hypothetical protein